jgi:hypothetical protein
VAALYITGTLLSITGASLLLGLVFDFLGSTLLAAGLVARPGPDGLRPAAGRLWQRLAPAVGQLLVVFAVLVGIAVVIALAGSVAITVVDPAFARNLGSGTAGLDALRSPAVLALGIAILVALAVLAGRLLPAAPLVLDRPVGAVDSLRAAWRATRSRTVACVALILISTAPSWLLVVLLPPSFGAFLTIISATIAVAVGVACYHRLFPTQSVEPGPGAAAQ